ncbi:hypothetical protein COO60DRAFT_340170 [Scenedesmus sp. NREL 46B-D3]|nr:hypothetical protein COO60DRAFT_340170 [Scenedesmus sp. NREL 46B-D3]
MRLDGGPRMHPGAGRAGSHMPLFRPVFGQPAATDERASWCHQQAVDLCVGCCLRCICCSGCWLPCWCGCCTSVTSEAIANSAEFKQLLPAAELEAHAASGACHIGHALMVECGKWNAADVPRLQVVRGEPARAWLWLRGPKPNSKREFAAGALPMTVIDGSTSSCLTGELITGTKFESMTTRKGWKRYAESCRVLNPYTFKPVCRVIDILTVKYGVESTKWRPS